MKNRLFAVLIFLVVGLCTNAHAAGSWCAISPETTQGSTTVASKSISKEISDSVNLVTGAAINPLLVVGGIGAYCWLDTPEQQRAQLPWHLQPWYWGPLVAIALLYLLGTLIGMVAHGSNKFTEAARMIEGNLQPIYALPAILPLIYSRFGGGIAQLQQIVAGLIPSAHAADAETIVATSLTPVLIAIGFALIYGVVWLTTLAVNTLVMLSPVPFLDAIIRAAHFSYVALLIGLSLISPYLGLLLTLPLVILALFISGWCFRLSVFGTVFAADILRFWRKIEVIAPLRAFAASQLQQVPVRTCGKVLRVESGLVFQYRPWLILPKQTVALPEAGMLLERGVLYPRLRCRNQQCIATWLAFPPRYRGQEDAVGQELGIASIENSAVLRGWAAVKAWLQSLFGKTLPAGNACP